MIKIAIMGYGVVGTGVARVLEQNRIQTTRRVGQEIEIKYILDLKDFPGDPLESLVIKDFAKIENDDDIKIVVEAIGGDGIAYEFTKRALLRGKSVCTSNKALMATHGPELIAIAKEKNINILFEAAVGGGIPLIRPFNDALLVDKIASVAGILNGTTNYILTQMDTKGKSYEDALKSAQDLGYAEQDPTADVEGHDAARKISILLSLATGKHVDFETVKTEGINVGAEDFAFANALGFTIKPMAVGRVCETGVEALVAPFLVQRGHPVSTVNDVFNGVMVKGETTGSVMFYGCGAGMMPTASAVVSDIADAALHLNRHIAHKWEAEKMQVLPVSEYVMRKCIRISCDNPEAFIKELATSTAQVATLPEYPSFIAWTTPAETQAQTNMLIEKIKSAPGFKAVERVLYIYDPEE
ncbi:MAG: homoserine dehydrogenase [Defluviitaleaceae bacterium]|nr:homoserine dehydrogenase [Defluviitaleaceae bacterium]